MDISSESQTPKSLSLPGTNYVMNEIIDCDQQGEPAYTTLANHLVSEWLNQALDSFELTLGDSSHQSDPCTPSSETSNGKRTGSENQTSGISGDTGENSAPGMKHLCHEALETSDNHLVMISKFCGEGRTAHGKCSNARNWNSLNRSPLVTNVPHKQLCHNDLLHTGETDKLNHSKGFICHTKSESFLQHGSKEVDYVESGHRVSNSEHSASSHVTIYDLHNLQNLTANTSKAEHNAEKNLCKFLWNDETVNQIKASVGQLLPTSTASLDNASSPVEDAIDGFSADVNANSDSTSAHRDIISQDLTENSVCKATNSFSDTVLSEDWNSSDNSYSSQIFFTGPAVQVSFCLLYMHSEHFIFAAYLIQAVMMYSFQNFDSGTR